MSKKLRPPTAFLGLFPHFPIPENSRERRNSAILFRIADLALLFKLALGDVPEAFSHHGDGLGNHPSLVVLQVLTGALADANEMICWIAAESLAQMGPAARSGVPALRQALERSYRLPAVPAGIRLALERIAAQPTDVKE